MSPLVDFVVFCCHSIHISEYKPNNSFILVSGILLNTKGRIFFSKKNHREGVYIHLCV
jgi:hypothetical protein